MNSEKEYFDINSSNSFVALTNSDGIVDADICIKPSNGFIKFQEIKNVKGIEGTLYIDSDELNCLGSLEYINGDLKIINGKNIKSLNNLKLINGDAILRYSAIEVLGKLKKVGGKLSLRDTAIRDLSNLEIVCGDLFLPKRLKSQIPLSLNVSGNLKFWSDKNTRLSTLLINENNSWGVNNQCHFSSIHYKELLYKKRFLSGEYLVKKCFYPSSLNSYVVENINEFYHFIDDKIGELYEEKYSFYDALFNQLLNNIEINREFPLIKLDRRKRINYTKVNKDVNELLKKKVIRLSFL